MEQNTEDYGKQKVHIIGDNRVITHVLLGLKFI